MILDDFSQWMKKNKELSDTSIYKYSLAIKTTSKEMQEIGIISKNLVDMNLSELDIAINVILKTPQFVEKNRKGNRMYSNSLKQFRLFALDVLDSDDFELEIASEIKKSKLPQTEKEAIIKARIGQGTYREELLKKYNSKCVMTGIDNKKLLIASHIKPWAICSNQERTDVENGLLLCANMDRLFDSGLITFDNSGHLYISSFLGRDNEKRLHINSDMSFDLKLTSGMEKYLEYHRDVLFVR
ncbi:MAG: HNH endonuclease [Firmicutes bacterium]|nr:HNH endonuclease [Bacillota bacterium]